MPDRSRTFQDSAKDRQDSPVLLSTSRFFGADDVRQTGHVDLEVFSYLLARCTTTKIVISRGPVREERDVEIPVVRDKGTRGAPIEGVLVERELDRPLNTGNPQRRVELPKGGGEATEVGSIA
jgi:hypothetical protein